MLGEATYSGLPDPRVSPSFLEVNGPSCHLPLVLWDRGYPGYIFQLIDYQRSRKICRFSWLPLFTSSGRIVCRDFAVLHTNYLAVTLVYSNTSSIDISKASFEEQGGVFFASIVYEKHVDT